MSFLHIYNNPQRQSNAVASTLEEESQHINERTCPAICGGIEQSCVQGRRVSLPPKTGIRAMYSAMRPCR